MADFAPEAGQSPTVTPVIPQKRPLGADDKHAPTVASPLNPDFNANQKKTREQREKKATYKVRGPSPEPQPSKKSKFRNTDPSVPSPLRYSLPNPKTADFDSPKKPLLVPGLLRAQRQYYEATEHIVNKRNFRYTRCVCDPEFPFSQYHRQSETEPYGPRISFEDTSPHIQYDQLMRSITTEKGFRLARANVGCREGRWYYECKILSGIKKATDDDALYEEGSGGHVRMGWARREASLDGPVGFDAYSYGLRDVGLQKVHMSRPKDFVTPMYDLCQGDVVGLEITLPSLSLHRKVVGGVYNKAVDVSDDPDPGSLLDQPNTIRDRIPIRYKHHLYFEQFEYHPTKDLEELMNPSQSITAAGASGITDPPNPNHPQVPLRTLPFSSIKVYKNGQLLGTPFTDLLAFLPPASKPITSAGAREGFDDGMLAYFPAVSVFRGGAAEVNFGPDFWYPPPDIQTSLRPGAEKDGDGDVQMTSTEVKASNAHSLLRPICERFDEQIAEDVVFDIVDEVDFCMQDGGELSKDGQTLRESEGSAVPATLNSEAPGTVATVMADAAGVSGEIKSMIDQTQ